MSGRRAIRRLRDATPETAEVLDDTPEGHGIASIDGKRVFIAGALRGETVSLRRVSSRRNYDEAQLLAINAASAERTEPRCEAFGRCGGCALQHLTAAAQLRLRERALLEALRRIGGVAPARVLPAVAGPSWAYRRRARLAVRHVAGKGRVLVGFSERASSRIAEMSRCETLHPAVAQLPGELAALIGGLALHDRIPQVEVAVGDNAIALVFRVLVQPGEADLAMLRAFRDRCRVQVLLQSGGPGCVTPLDAGVDDRELWYTIGDPPLRMCFGPTDFIQVNAAINERLVALALELLQPNPASRVLDLYCGIGNFSLPLAQRGAYVLGLEGDPAMTARARHNAQLNGIEQAEFRVADLGAPDACGAMLAAAPGFDAALIDPPRAGAAAVLPFLAASGVRRILYVSCHPATLARDCGALITNLGYRLSAAGVLDMFPHTSHSESVALLERD